MKKNVSVVLLLVGLLIIAALLMFLARGKGYTLTVFDPAIGSADAPILLEEFSDFECPACAAAAPVVKQVLAEYPNQIRFVYKDFPLSSIHLQAQKAAVGALCAAQQGKFIEIHDDLFAQQGVWASAQAASGSDVTAFLGELAVKHGLNVDDFNACIASRTARSQVSKDFNEGQKRAVDSTPSFFINGEKIENPGSVFQWIKLIDEKLTTMGITPENRVTIEE